MGKGHRLPPLLTASTRPLDLYTNEWSSTISSPLSSASSGSVYPPTPTDIECITPAPKSSSLSFAAFYDPSGDGLLAFTGSKLLNAPLSAKFRPPLPADARAKIDVLKRNYKRTSHDPTGRALSSKNNGEPFTVLGSRDSCYIGLSSSDAYENYIRGDGGLESLKPIQHDKSQGANLNMGGLMPPPVPQKPSRMHQPKKSSNTPLGKPKPKVPVGTPNSALTFAAVWDPEGGMSTFAGKGLLDRSSSNLEGLDIQASRPGAPRFKRRDLGHGFRFSRNLSSLDLSHHMRPIDEVSVDDEGFFETFTLQGQGHPDCEPHLPSRFSTTTTSTSNYINVDFGQDSIPEENIPQRERILSTDSKATVRSHASSSSPLDRVLSMRSVKSVRSRRKSNQRPEISTPLLLLPTRRHPGGVSLAAPLPPPSLSPSSPQTSSSPSPVDHTSSFEHPPPFTRSHTEPTSITSPRSPLDMSPLKRQYSHQTLPEKGSKSRQPRLSQVFGKFRRQASDDDWVYVQVTSVITEKVVTSIDA